MLNLRVICAVAALWFASTTATYAQQVNSPQYHALYNAQSVYYIGNTQGVAASGPPGPNLIGSLLDGMAVGLYKRKMAREREDELMNDPEYRKLKAGYWDFGKISSGDDGNIACRAVFKSLTGMIGIIAPIRAGEPALLLLTGVDVPAPAKPVEIKVNMRQKGPDAVGMPFVNLTAGENQPGTLVTAAPHLSDLLMGMADVEDFSAMIGNKRVYEMRYQDGNTMKAYLQQCVNANRSDPAQ